MAKKPSCCLYLAFLIHFSAFASLLVAYSTPKWTLVKMSTGEIRSLGLVVTCDREKCDLLHVTSARNVLVIVFGMCTFCILMSLFSIQTFCLALCNRSCKEKNLGTCLSYFSLFIAFSIGGTLGLYQIDLREEAKPDVVDMWMGWSRYCIMGAAGGFFLGAWLNAADYLLRNRAQNRELIKRAADIKAKVASHPMHQNQTRGGNVGTLRPNETRRTSLAERRMQYANRDKWRTPMDKNRLSPRMFDTVESAMRSSMKKDCQQDKYIAKDRCQNATIDSNRIQRGGGPQGADKKLVQIAKEHRVKSINVKEAPRINVTTSSAGRDPRKPISENKMDDPRNSTKREDKVEFSEAALKYRLERLHQLVSLPTTIEDKQLTPLPTKAEDKQLTYLPAKIEDKRKLSAVQEEPRDNEREKSTTPKEKKVLNRQETKTLVGHGLLQSTASMSDEISGIRDTGQGSSGRDSKTLKSQLSVESKASNKVNELDSSKIYKNISRHTKPHPLQRDDQIISSQENSFGSNAKLNQTKQTSRSLEEQNSSSYSLRLSKDDVIPPIKRETKIDNSTKKNNRPSTDPVSKTDSRINDNARTTSIASKPLGVSLEEKPKNSVPSLDSTISSELSEEQIKRRQIVESMLQAKKNRKKKRITQ